MALTKKYQSVQTAIASYEYTDIASGVGYTIFYPTTSRVADTLNYDLQTSILEPGLSTWQSFHERSSVLNAEVIFATPAFKLPRTVEGDVFLNFSLSTSSTGGAVNITMKVYKNTTQIGTTTWLSPAVNLTLTANVKIAVPRTLFGVGDQLKVSWNADNGAKQRLMHDPLNRDAGTFVGDGTFAAVVAATFTTKAQVHVPFAIDI